MTQLSPPSARLAELLIQMTRLDWPTGEEDRRHYFHTLGLHDLNTPAQREDDPETRTIRFISALPDVDGTCTMFRGEFLGISLFCYTEAVDNGHAARAGYAGLSEELTHALGVPNEEWGTSTQPACLWRTGPLWIDMYCFRRLPSGVMVGPTHAERSAAHDAAHDARQPRPRADDIHE